MSAFVKAIVGQRRRRDGPRGVDEAPLRRIGWRLAALTVGLLCVLVLVLGLAVYLTMQTELQHTVRQEVRDHAASEVSHLRDEIADPGDHHDTERGASDALQATDAVFITFANTSLTIVDADDGSPFGQALPDRAAARQALLSRTARFSTRRGPGDQQYVLYTLPVVTNGQAQGIIQAGVPEGPYLASLRTLLTVLLLVSSLGLVVVTIISGLVVQRALRPIRGALCRQRDFVADAAHELRTPVTILRSAAELGLVAVADREQTPETIADQQAAFEQTMIQSNHLARLVDDLSLLARADSGTLTLDRAPVNLTRLIADMTTGVQLLAQEQGIHIEATAAEDICIMGDAGRLRQLLLILLDNALKHTPAGGSVAVCMERQGRRVRLRVRDSGVGIAPQDLPHLFDRFYRAARTRTSEGSGLGLAIARWIAEAHGGDIKAANAADHGAILTVTLPCGL